MLATAVSTLPSGDEWAYEFKWDGVPTLLHVTERGVRRVSRVGRRVSSVYVRGLRSEDWLQLRLVRYGDFAVVGWEAAAEHPKPLSSLVLAAFSDGSLEYAGRVGSGLAGRVATNIKGMLSERP